MHPARILARTVQCFFLGVFITLTLSALSYGEADIGQLVGIHDKGELKRMAEEAEKVYKKNSKDKENLIKLGVAYHNLATMDVDDASEKAETYLKELVRLSPDDALSLALLGSAVSMVGRDSYNIVKKMSNVNKASDMLDRAVTMDPDNILVRMIRANNSMDIPKSFGRQKIGKDDLLHIEGIIKKAPEDVSSDFQAEVYYKLGNVYKSEENASSAKAYFKKVTEVSPDSEWGKKAKKEL